MGSAGVSGLDTCRILCRGRDGCVSCGRDDDVLRSDLVAAIAVGEQPVADRTLPICGVAVLGTGCRMCFVSRQGMIDHRDGSRLGVAVIAFAVACLGSCGSTGRSLDCLVISPLVSESIGFMLCFDYFAADGTVASLSQTGCGTGGSDGCIGNDGVGFLRDNGVIDDDGMCACLITEQNVAYGTFPVCDVTFSSTGRLMSNVQNGRMVCRALYLFPAYTVNKVGIGSCPFIDEIISALITLPVFDVSIRVA